VIAGKNSTVILVFCKLIVEKSRHLFFYEIIKATKKKKEEKRWNRLPYKLLIFI